MYLYLPALFLLRYTRSHTTLHTPLKKQTNTHTHTGELEAAVKEREGLLARAQAERERAGKQVRIFFQIVMYLTLFVCMCVYDGVGVRVMLPDLTRLE